MVRSNNQDSGFAGKQLFLVADGMGGHAGGDVASALVAQDVAGIDEIDAGSPSETTIALRKRVLEANKLLRATVKERPELAGMGTTFCGFITVENRLALAHIGDSRLYLFRNDKLRQITKDHTFVQRLVDSGRITEEEAQVHPRRSVLMRVLGDVEAAPDIDTEVLDTQPGDVWLLCSDGLCGYVDDHEIEKILRRRHSLQNGVDALIDKSLAHGAPDNVTVVLVETTGQLSELETGEQPDRDVEQPPNSQATPDVPVRRFAGSAANSPDTRDGETTTARTRLMGRRRPVRRPPQIAESHFEPRVDEYLAELIAETKRRNYRRRLLGLLVVIAVLAAVGGGLFYGYQWTQSRYFVGTNNETVIIYRGVQQNIGSFSLHSVAERTKIPVSSLGGYEQQQLARTISARCLEEARDIVERLGADSNHTRKPFEGCGNE